MTILRPDARRAARVQELPDSPAARVALGRLLDADPIVNAVVAARVRAAGSLDPGRLGGQVLGVAGPLGLAGACFVGGNLLPIGGDVPAWHTLGRHLAGGRVPFTSVVGRADAVAALWAELAPRFGPARAMRAKQPMLVIDHVPVAAAHPDVRPATAEHLERYLAAAAAMFTEELGVSPHISPGTEAFRARIGHLIDRGQAFVVADFRGQVVFKAEIAAVSRHTAQVQGVWVRPDLRGRGVGTAALASVFRQALTRAPTVSLYVNDFNVAARRTYERLGMREHAVLSTVLLP